MEHVARIARISFSTILTEGGKEAKLWKQGDVVIINLKISFWLRFANLTKEGQNS